MVGDDEFDPRNRELCPDGACIGVIGPDGRCRACGAVAPSVVTDARHRGLEDPVPVTGVPDTTDEDDIENRQLCPDGACIGVIGPGGRCKECGRAADTSS